MTVKWEDVLNEVEAEEFAMLEMSIAHLKKALTALSERRQKLQNRAQMRAKWRNGHVGGKRHVD